ncbi:transcription-repair coupling factor, putative [Babesia ovata]|uniref:Transcription-repair coupling factor, putative n=1 Tax=Babesia ovata TaxID=189622 RepID=A0A2H6KB40_9APIC|nr:transcription-repair coupling factor, putative [Babesia ovata]GBE60212.1 transcription-repair coupling factor, putative [Babesia ovata]
MHDLREQSIKLWHRLQVNLLITLVHLNFLSRLLNRPLGSFPDLVLGAFVESVNGEGKVLDLFCKFMFDGLKIFVAEENGVNFAGHLVDGCAEGYHGGFYKRCYMLLLYTAIRKFTCNVTLNGFCNLLGNLLTSLKSVIQLADKILASLLYGLDVLLDAVPISVLRNFFTRCFSGVVFKLPLDLMDNWTTHRVNLFIAQNPQLQTRQMHTLLPNPRLKPILQLMIILPISIIPPDGIQPALHSFVEFIFPAERIRIVLYRARNAKETTAAVGICLRLPLNLPNLLFNMLENLIKSLQITSIFKRPAKRLNRLVNFTDRLGKRSLDMLIKLLFKPIHRRLN